MAREGSAGGSDCLQGLIISRGSRYVYALLLRIGIHRHFSSQTLLMLCCSALQCRVNAKPWKKANCV